MRKKPATESVLYRETRHSSSETAAGQYLLETIQVPISDVYDVIVLGGGIAGVSAALSSVRNGAKTLLIEKQCALGGLATTGQVIVYLPLCDGFGNRILGGIPAELLALAVSCGYNTLPQEWRGLPMRVESDRRCESVFNAPAFAFALERLLIKENCKILFDTRFCHVALSTDERNHASVTHVFVENCDGRNAYACRSVVDATGNAALFAAAGAECVAGGGNILTYWSYAALTESPLSLGKSLDCTYTPNVKMLYIGDHLGQGVPENSRNYKGTNAADTTAFLLDAHEIALRRVEQDGAELLSIPGMAQFRRIRRIVGAYTLAETDCGRPFPDAVARVPDWRSVGRIFEVPYRALYSQAITNAFAAGRHIAADGDVWEIMRVIPAAAATGQAAGCAAALQVKTNRTCSTMDTSRLRLRLAKDGAFII